jgi:hypothetical protein
MLMGIDSLDGRNRPGAPQLVFRFDHFEIRMAQMTLARRTMKFSDGRGIGASYRSCCQRFSLLRRVLMKAC